MGFLHKPPMGSWDYPSKIIIYNTTLLLFCYFTETNNDGLLLHLSHFPQSRYLQSILFVNCLHLIGKKYTPTFRKLANMTNFLKYLRHKYEEKTIIRRYVQLKKKLLILDWSHFKIVIYHNLYASIISAVVLHLFFSSFLYNLGVIISVYNHVKSASECTNIR